MTSERENLLNFTIDDAEVRLAAAMTELGEPAYRVGQVVRRLWHTPAASFADMTELPAALRELAPGWWQVDLARGVLIVR